MAGERVGFDFDGVLAMSDFPVIEAVEKLVVERTGKKIQIRRGDLSHFDAVPEIVKKVTNNPELAKEAQLLWFDAVVLRRAPLYKSMVEEVERMVVEDGIVPYVITTRIPNCRMLTLEQLEKEMRIQGINWEKRLMIRSKNDERDGDQFKADEIYRLGIIHFVEDRTETLKFLQNSLDGRCTFSYANQPWNQNDIDIIRGGMRFSPNRGEVIRERVNRMISR